MFKGQEKSAFVYVAGVVLLFDLVKNTFQCHLYKSAKKGSCYAWDGQAKGQSILKSLDAISLHKQDKEQPSPCLGHFQQDHAFSSLS